MVEGLFLNMSHHLSSIYLPSKYVYFNFNITLNIMLFVIFYFAFTLKIYVRDIFM